MSCIHKCLQANNFNGIFSRQEFSQEVTLNKNKLILRYSILKVTVDNNSFPALRCTETHAPSLHRAAFCCRETRRAKSMDCDVRQILGQLTVHCCLAEGQITI